MSDSLIGAGFGPPPPPPPATGSGPAPSTGAADASTADASTASTSTVGGAPGAPAAVVAPPLATRHSLGTAVRAGGERLDRRAAEVIDRSQIIEAMVDGQVLRGYAGDTAASLLGAHGRRTFFGSLHEQRPGGVRTADRFDQEAWVWVEGIGLTPAAAHLVRDGERLSAHQRRATTPSAVTPMARFHLAGRSRISRLAARGPVAPPWLAALRRSGTGAEQAEGLHSRVDVVVVGGGMAGLCAARAAADEGASVVLVEADDWLGGRLRWSGHFDEQQRLADIAVAVAGHPSITVMTSTIACETRPDGTVLTVERREGAEQVAVLRAGAVVLATGTSDRRLPFGGDHLPGVMTPSGVRRLVELWAVRPGEQALLCSDQRGYLANKFLAVQLNAIGVDVLDVLVLADGAGHLEAGGPLALEQVHLPSGRRYSVDLLVASFGAQLDPTLVNGLGGVVTRLPGTEQSVIGNLPANAAVVGDLAGATKVEETEVLAGAAGRRLARLVGESARRHRVAPPPAPVVVTGTEPSVLRPVSGLLDAALDLRVEVLDGFAASTAAATEHLVHTSRLGGLTPPARVVLADLARSAATSADLVDLVLAGGGPLGGPAAGALALLHRPAVRRSPMVDLHVGAGARFAPCDGWLEVLHYGDPDAELDALRNGVGVWDRSSGGWFAVRGPRAAAVVAEVAGRPVADDPLDEVRDPEPGGTRRVVRVGPDRWELFAALGHGASLEAELLAASLAVQPWEAVVAAQHEDSARVRIAGPSTVEVLETMGLTATPGRRERVRVGELDGWLLGHGVDDVELQVVAPAGRALWSAVLSAGDRLAARPVGAESFERSGRVTA
ncbi:MAG: FAD-dependent oxidoreductase [Acidimicrobiales bacterium]|nr:FAD-dependent oxidoreductase [Acidimicrobiales bacterium]